MMKFTSVLTVTFLLSSLSMWGTAASTYLDDSAPILASGEGDGAGWVSIALDFSERSTAEVSIDGVGSDSTNRTTIAGGVILSPEGVVEVMMAGIIIRGEGYASIGFATTGNSRWYSGFSMDGRDGLGITVPVSGVGRVIVLVWTPGDATHHTWVVRGPTSASVVDVTSGAADLPYALDAHQDETTQRVEAPTGAAEVRRSSLRVHVEHRLFSFWFDDPQHLKPCVETGERWVCSHFPITLGRSDWDGPTRQAQPWGDRWMRGEPPGDYVFWRDEARPGRHCGETICVATTDSPGDFFLSGADAAIATF